MSIQDVITEVIENAENFSSYDFEIEIEADSVELKSFEWSGYSPDYEVDCDEARARQIHVDGNPIEDYCLVPQSVIHALGELDLSEIVEADQGGTETDPVDVVSIDSIQHVLRDMVMRKRDFAGVWEVIERAQIRDSELASEAENVSLDEAIADAAVAESIEIDRIDSE